MKRVVPLIASLVSSSNFRLRGSERQELHLTGAEFPAPIQRAEVIMTALNVRTFLEHKRFERRRRAAICYAISGIAAIAVLCAVRQMSENSCERVVLGPSSALARTFEIEGGTLDPDGPLLLRPALDPAPTAEKCGGASWRDKAHWVLSPDIEGE